MKHFLFAGLMLSAFSLFTFAQQSPNPYEDIKAKVESTLGLKVNSVADSPIQGLVQIETDKGLFYASPDASYLVQGRIFNLNQGMRNETEVVLAKLRKQGLHKFEDSVIEFKAKNEKYVVNVFTDVSCGYCRKLHSELKDYNDLGISVRYLAFPRGGIRSQSYTDLVNVWCAKDQQKALTQAKSGEEIKSSTCSNKVAEQYDFGSSIGVGGTPNIILPDGSLVGGYVPAKRLAEALKNI